MRFPPASDIRKLRKVLDVTQAELAKRSGISQSAIAKIERENISPSYDTVVKLFETLENMSRNDDNHKTAVDVASKGVVTIQCTEKVRAASDLMKTTGFSQLPVLKGEVPVGSISERTILELIRQGKTMDELSGMSVARVMGDMFPVVNENTPMDTVTTLMGNANAVLVARKGKIIGVLTSADLLKLI